MDAARRGHLILGGYLGFVAGLAALLLLPPRPWWVGALVFFGCILAGVAAVAVVTQLVTPKPEGLQALVFGIVGGLLGAMAGASIAGIFLGLRGEQLLTPGLVGVVVGAFVLGWAWPWFAGRFRSVSRRIRIAVAFLLLLGFVVEVVLEGQAFLSQRPGDWLGIVFILVVAVVMGLALKAGDA